MAQIDIDAERLADDPASWPDCCARCGSAGTKLVPVPARYVKNSDDLSIPLCPAHVDDWAKVRFRTRLGALAILLGMAAAAIATWELQPRIANPINQNNPNRIAAAVMLGFLAAIPIGLLAAWWAKSPIRILAQAGRIATLAGVCKSFASALKDRPAQSRPEVPATVRFDVAEYRPTPTVAPELAMHFLGIAFAVAISFGVAVGFSGLEIARVAAGWDANDWRYLPMVAAVAQAYVIPLIGYRFLFSRYGLVVLVVAIGTALAGVLAFRLFGGPFRIGFGILFAGAPFLLEFVVVHRLIWRWRIRSVAVAVSAGFLGPLVLAGIAYLIAGMESGPHQVAYVLGPIAAFASAATYHSAARTPFCAECEAWLDGRRIGALPRTRGEVEPALAAGEVVSLAATRPYEETATIGDVELWVHSCGFCRDRGTVVLELFDCRKGGKNGQMPRLVKAGRWRYPGPALLVIEEMFPPQFPSIENPQSEPSDSA